MQMTVTVHTIPRGSKILKGCKVFALTSSNTTAQRTDIHADICSPSSVGNHTEIAAALKQQEA